MKVIAGNALYMFIHHSIAVSGCVSFVLFLSKSCKILHQELFSLLQQKELLINLLLDVI